MSPLRQRMDDAMVLRGFAERIIPPDLREKPRRPVNSGVSPHETQRQGYDMRYFGKLLIISLIVGCASQGMEDYANQENWAAAFESMQYQMYKEQPDALSRARSLVRDYPAILQFGYETFAPDKLKNYADHLGEVEWHKIRLGYFCAVASTEQCIQAKENVDEAERNIRPLIAVLKEFYEQLSPTDLQSLNARNRIKLIPGSEVGVVTDRQLQDLSTPGSSAGSQLGAAIGSAAYVDDSFSGGPSNWNYSASGHLGAQVVGAVVGGALGNRPAQQRYRI